MRGAVVKWNRILTKPVLSASQLESRRRLVDGLEPALLELAASILQFGHGPIRIAGKTAIPSLRM